MKTMIFTSSPNENGLTYFCGEYAKAGALEGNSEVVVIDLNKININHCKSCGNGWGQCLSDHKCIIEDEFQNLHKSMMEMDAFVFITPVYWGEMSESMKTFTDRIRRCEAWKKEKSLFNGKPIISVAAAGGSGNGLISCLASMERFVMHVSGEKFDFISITRKTREFKLETIKASAKAMVISK
ncbi:flavodoxin family protein [Clostridium sp.]|uniref:flavodoxin family protein n=1 Tax=Clostridium sp. TaxID=1506 RepID=UPI002FCA9620